MALAPGLAALKSTGCLDSLILSTQLGETFLSHQAISLSGLPLGLLRHARSVWQLCFPLPRSSFQGESGVWDGRWASPSRATSTVHSSPALAP